MKDSKLPADPAPNGGPRSLGGSGGVAVANTQPAQTTQPALAESWTQDERGRLRQMFAQSPGFMAMLHGPQHVFDLVNPAYLQLIGHREVIGLPMCRALPEIEGQGFLELLDRVYTSGEAYSANDVAVDLQRTRDSAREQRFVDFVYQPLRSPDGVVFGIFVQGSDVTQRMVAEKAMRTTEAHNRQVLDSAIDYAIIAFDLAGRVTRWNEGAHRILGWTEEEMLGQDCARIFTPEDRAALREESEMALALLTGVGSDERWHMRKSGERFWANGEMTPIRDDSGCATGFVKVLRDRTEQHRAAQALRESDERLRRAQEAGGVGTFTFDLSSRLLSGTPEFYRIFGVPDADEVRVGVFEDMVMPEDREIRARAAAPDAGNASVEYRIRRAGDGELRWIARKADFERDAQGRALRMLGVVQDVTERKTAQRALEESAAQFRTLAQALPNHVWTASVTGMLGWFNDRVYEYSGARPGALDGQAWAQIVHAEDVVAAAERWAASIASGKLYETEFRIRRADGMYRWHLARALPIRAEDGVISRWIGTNTDIHERKLLEAESMRDRNRIWSLSRELMMVCNFDGGILAVNPAATRLLGWSEDEMVGGALARFLHPDDLERTSAEIAKLGAGATTLAFENRYRSRDGSYRVLNWTNVPDGGRIHAVARDVTRERMAEDALRQAQKMEAVGQLTGGIAHDFNNLLQGIMGSLNVVQKFVAMKRVAEIDRFIDSAMSSARRAAALTHRLLAFSRRQPLEPRPVQVNPLLASMEDLLRRALGETVDLRMALAPGLWVTKCDPNQLENAILNLAINSRDAMPSGGTLTLETSNTALDSAFTAAQDGVLPGAYVCIAVTDTGIGMSADTISRAFEPFFTTKPLGQGTGLGLSMIYGFARQSEGYARIYSEPGQGTTLKLYLPRERGLADGEEQSPSHAAPPMAPATGNVLLVEDEPVVRGLIVQVLGDLGYTVTEAADGLSGLRLLQTMPGIDLLISDVGLPGMNGRQLAEAGRALRPGLKVLFMTGYAEDAVFASGLLDPGMSMITKPFAMDALVARVREVIDSR